MTKCVQSNLEKYSAGQDSRLKNIEVQINQLNSYTSYLNGHHIQPRHHGVGSTTSTRVQHTPSVLADVQINNPTKHIEERNNDFLPEELSNRVSVFLDGCNKFNVNTENGHSVVMFGYLYHYNGSKHTNQPTEIPSPIKEVLDAINEKYPNEELNSYLINKYMDLSRICQNMQMMNPLLHQTLSFVLCQWGIPALLVLVKCMVI